MANATYSRSAARFNKSEIMRNAWRHYRRSFSGAFDRKGFVWALKSAWRGASVQRHFTEQEARRAAMTATERRVGDVETEIDHLGRLPLAQHVGARRAALLAELNALAA